MQKQIIKKSSDKKVFTYTIFTSQFSYSSFAMENLFTLNLTVGSCEKLRYKIFKNICIEFDCEPFTIREHKLIAKVPTDYNYYVVCYTWNGLIIPNFCNTVSDILMFMNEYLKDTINTLQRIVIVNCTNTNEG